MSSSQSFEEVSSLSEVQSQDIPSFNDTADSNQTITSSLKGVDMPVFEETSKQQDMETPVKLKPLDDEWQKSPELGIYIHYSLQLGMIKSLKL